MDRAARSGHQLELLVGLVCVSAIVVGATVCFWPRQRLDVKSMQREASPSPALNYQPRTSFDSSGFQLFRDGLPRWSEEASLQEIRQIWHEHCVRGLALANSPTPALHPRSQQDVEFVFAQVMLANCEGATERAYELLGQLRTGVEQIPQMAEKVRFTVIYLQGVTSLRLGEDENCILCRGESSCILPISRAARHTKPRGSRQAIFHFTEYLNQFPEDLSARWLLNLAHMTLGEHPEQVDPRFVLAMESDEDPAMSIGVFKEIGERTGVNRYNHAGGGIMDDFDNDGWLDIVTTSVDATQHMAVFRNDAQGAFRESWDEAKVTEQFGGLYCVQADFNEDGFLDIFIPRGAWLHSPIRPSLLMNQGDGTFFDVTEIAGLRRPGNSNSASWADYNNDGYLDLYVCCERQPNRLYQSSGDGSFVEVAADAGVQGSQEPTCKAAVWIDYDNDADSDLFLNYYGGKAMLFRNDRNGTFTDVTGTQGINGPERGFSAWAWDYDNDGWLDLFATCYDQTLDGVVRGLQRQPHQGRSSRLFHNLQGQKFEDKTRDAGLDLMFATMGSNYGDFDNDGFLDIYLGTGEPRYDMLVPNRMFRNVAGGKFAEITAASRTGHLQKGHSVACGDWNRDGQTDLFVETGGASNGDRAHNLLFENPGHSNSWVTLRLIGQKSNRSALGARIKIVTRQPVPQTFYRHVSSGSTFGANALEQNIGLGQAEGIELLEVHWPASGTTQTIRNLDADQVLLLRESSSEVFKMKYSAVRPAPSKATPMER